MELDFIEYPRGFVFSDFRCSEIPKHYNSKMILDKYYYYYHNELKENIYFIDNNFIIIHGYHKYVGFDKNINNDNFLESLLINYIEDYTEFLNILDFLAGRYVIIIGNEEKVEFYQDATAARSVYFSLNCNIVSSHAHLINDITSHELDEITKIIKAHGISWNNSPYEKIKALTPNLLLDFYSKKTRRFFPRSNNKYKKLSEEERFEIVEKLWKSQFEYYFSKFDKVVFSITGGWDSRVNLAMFREKLDEMEFFTYTTNQAESGEDFNKNLILKDGVIVKKLLSVLPLNHKFIVQEEVNKKLSERDKFIVSKNEVSRHNRGFLFSYKTMFPGKLVLHIRSNIHEIGRAYILPKNAADTPEKVTSYFLNNFKNKHKELLSEHEIKLEEIAFNGIESFQYTQNTFDFHLLELFYWENRMGRWHSEILNETDVCFETFTPFNVRAIIEISLSFEYNKRKSNYLFSELINRNHPILNFFGKNDYTNLYEENKKLINDNEGRTSLNEIRKQNIRRSEKIYDKISNLRKEVDTVNNKLTKKLGEIISLNEQNVVKVEDVFNIQKEKVLFENFEVGNLENKKKVETIEKNTLFLYPMFLGKENYAQYNYRFNLDYGALNLKLINGYKSSKAKDNIEYKIFVNNHLYLKEDISMWHYDNNINIFNLHKDDIVTIKLEVNKNLKSSTWQHASRLKITSLAEINIEDKHPVNITASSPYSQLFN